MFDCTMVCLDIDGTLLDSRHRITPRVKEAIRRTEDRGVPVVLASARGPGGILFIYEELELSSPVICYNGGLILDHTKTTIHSRALDLDPVGRVAELALEMDITLSLYRGAEWFVSREDDWSRAEAEVTRMTPIPCHLPTLAARWRREGQSGPNKLLAMAPEDRVLALQDRVAREGLDLDTYRSFPTYLELVARGLSKAEGMLRLTQLLGLDPGGVLAAGDNFNDLAMIQAAGLGVAMGNAPEEVRAQADFVTATNDQDGVALALEQWVLGA